METQIKLLYKSCGYTTKEIDAHAAVVDLPTTFFAIMTFLVVIQRHIWKAHLMSALGWILTGQTVRDAIS